MIEFSWTQNVTWKKLIKYLLQNDKESMLSMKSAVLLSSINNSLQNRLQHSGLEIFIRHRNRIESAAEIKIFEAVFPELICSRLIICGPKTLYMNQKTPHVLFLWYTKTPLWCLKNPFLATRHPRRSIQTRQQQTKDKTMQEVLGMTLAQITNNYSISIEDILEIVVL